MTATQIAQLLGPRLRAQGFHADVAAWPMPNGYGHKIELLLGGRSLGSVVVYAGKKGPRLVTSELQQPSSDVLARITNAWRGIGLAPPEATTGSSAAAAPGSHDPQIELWVDGACLQEHDSLKFGWACLIRKGTTEVYRHASSRILPHMAPHRNVAAELQAVVHGLELCRQRGYVAVTVFYDYAGIEAWATKRWKRNTRTTQEYTAFIEQCPLTITWQKVAAHTGVSQNELVDSLATGAARASFESYAINRLPSPEAS